MRIRNLKSVWMATSILGAAVYGTAGVSFAQDSDTESDAPIEVVEETEDEAVSVQDKIVVTGSRLRRDEFSATSPVQVITSETSTLQGLVSAAEILQSSSVAAGSGQINNTFTGFVVDGGAGVDTISLRGLGAQRSLVLLNGRRMPPAGVGGTVGPVDLNVLPNSIIQRIEVLKDGASSVYGSDAVAGVVNVITRDNIDGFELTGTIDVPEAGGAEEFVIGGVWGESFDRGSFNVSGEYYRQEELTIGDRDNLACPQDFYFDANGERADAIDPRTNDFKCYNSLEGYFQTFYSPNAPFGLAGSFYGSRVPDAAGTNYEGIPGYRFIPFQERSFDDPRDLRTSAISPRERMTLYATGQYRPAAFENTELYGELLYNRRESNQNNNRQLFPWYHPDSSLNPYSGDQVFDFGPLFGLDPGLFVAPIDGFTARPIVLVPFDQSQEVNVFRGLAGARGEFNNGWAWDAFASYSMSDGEYTRDVIPADRVDAGTGTLQNTIGLNPDGICGPSAPAGCVPLDLFNTATLFDGEFSPEAAAYYLLEETGQTEYTQAMFEATVTGDLFEMPAGQVGGAFGVHVRRDEIDDVPGEFSRGSYTPPGQTEAIPGNAWGLLTAVETAGTDTVSELFGEVEIPLIRNKVAFEDLTLNLSARYSNYDSVGDATTYKVGLNWALGPGVRFRGTHGTSFRAPSLFELYLGDQTSFLSQVNVDPCIGYGLTGDEATNVDPIVQANCAADGLPGDWGGGGSSAEIRTGGGLDLEPEDSTATTFGIVITPEETNFSFAADYFRIEVENEIASLAGAVVGRCYADADFRGEPGFCDLFTRVLDPTASNFGTITDIDASFRNIPNQLTSGFDFTARYEHEFDFGEVTFDGQATYTKDDESQDFVGSPFISFNGIIGEPEWVGNTQTRFERGDWTTTWSMNYTGHATNIGYEGEDGQVNPFYAPNSTTIASVDSFITHDLSVRKQWDTFTAVFGVRNVLDEEPPIISDGDDLGSPSRLGNYPLSSQYYQGYIGRSFFMTLNKQF